MNYVTGNGQKNLLLLSYWFPPGVGAAAERMCSFAAYLPDAGWNVHVVCADRVNAEANRTDELPHITRITDPMAMEGPLFADYDPRQPATPTWKRLLRRFVFPDRFVRWKKAASWKVIELCASTRFDAVLASFPPASVVQLAMEAREASGAPLVLDFRDRWIGPGGYEPESDRLRRRHRALERMAVRRAAAVLAVSENMADAIAEENGIDRARVHVLPNGYEPIADWEAQQPNEDGANDGDHPIRTGLWPLTIAHVGTVIPRNRPERFFESLRLLKLGDQLPDARFRFVGNLSRDYIKSIELNGVIESTGLVDRTIARREMRDADALLLLVGDYVGRWGHNAKVFEYVQAGRPILCLEESPGSNDGELLKRFVGERTFFAPLGDGAALVEAVARLGAYVADRPSAAIELRPEFRTYSRRELAVRLHEVLTALT